eukprot:GHVL01004646.1.p1 GENE.GHVL01004646.1~~GHVL01004646.1.p1  ORF type:complete len:398 (-),score=56.39 GHVL01004646.1:2401-3594(-)
MPEDAASPYSRAFGSIKGMIATVTTSLGILPSPEPNDLIVVTGANGLVASHCIKVLLQSGYTVRATVRDPNDPVKTSFLKQLGDPKKLQLVQGDLQKYAGWEDVISEGVTHVLHVASPLPVKKYMSEKEVVRPAVEGTMNVLKACSKCKSVKRVVLTSSMAAVESAELLKIGRTLTDKDWGDETSSSASPYQKSKIIAEREAWRFVKDNKVHFEMVAINPAVIIGPILSDSQKWSSPMEVVQRLMDDKLCRSIGLPDISFCYVDVRDVARTHIVAMKHPKAPNNRFITCTAKSISFMELVSMIEHLDKGEYIKRGFQLPTKTGPKALYQAGQYVAPSVAQFLERWGLEQTVDTVPLHKTLGIRLMTIEDSLRDTIESALEFGVIKNPSKKSDTCCCG